MNSFVGVNDPGSVNSSRRGSVASNAGSVSSLNNTLARFRAAFPGRSNANKKSMANKARNAYTRKVNAARKTWLASHGMPKTVNARENERIRKNAVEYVKRVHGFEAAKYAGLEGGRRRKTRRSRKGRKGTRKH